MSRVLDKLAVNATRMTRFACFGALVAMFVAISPATSSAQSAPSSGLDVPTTKLSQVRLLQEINQPDLDFDAVELIIKREVALSLKLRDERR